MKEAAADLSTGTGSISQDCASSAPIYLVQFTPTTVEQHFSAVFSILYKTTIHYTPLHVLNHFGDFAKSDWQVATSQNTICHNQFK